MRYQGENGFRHDAPEHTGILLANLGTPDEPTPAALRRYLGEFLWDPRVVEIPRPLWWLILHGIILRTRPAKSAAKYRTIWTEDGSPLLSIGWQQLTALELRLQEICPGPVKIALGMRYGNPSIADALAELKNAGVRRLLVLPLYPQYAAATAGSVFDAVSRVLHRWRWVPHLRFIGSYHDHPGYLDALARSIREAWETDGQPEKLLFSFHGLPRRNLDLGDPYHCQCHATARQVAQRLGLADDRWQVSFQSRFGRAEWLKPYTSETLAAWGRQGINRVDVACPGFSADCLETLEEIAIENRDVFLAAGGEHYRYIPALNDRADHIDMMADLVVRNGAGWPGIDASVAMPGDEVLAARRGRATKLGAPR